MVEISLRLIFSYSYEDELAKVLNDYERKGWSWQNITPLHKDLNENKTFVEVAFINSIKEEL